MIVLKNHQNVVLAQKLGDKKWKSRDREITIETRGVDRYDSVKCSCYIHALSRAHFGKLQIINHVEVLQISYF